MPTYCKGLEFSSRAKPPNTPRSIISDRQYLNTSYSAKVLGRKLYSGFSFHSGFTEDPCGYHSFHLVAIFTTGRRGLSGLASARQQSQRHSETSCNGYFFKRLYGVEPKGNSQALPENSLLFMYYHFVKIPPTRFFFLLF